MSTKANRYIKHQKALQKLLDIATDEDEINFTGQKASDFVEADEIEVDDNFVGETKTKLDAEGNPITMNAEDFMKSQNMEGAASTGTKIGTDTGTGLDMTGYGTAAGAVGSAATSLLNLGVTLASKEDRTQNPFVGFATDALTKIGDIKTMAGRIKDLERADLTLSEQTQRARNRNIARGTGTLRALELGTHVAGIGAKRGIEKDYTRTLIDTTSKEADLLLNRDNVIMSAEERRMDKDQANRDNYLTNLSSNITDFGTMFQQLGRNANIARENEIGVKLAGSGKYGTSKDYLDEFDINY